VEEFNSVAMEIYPNPTDGMVNVHYNLPEKMSSTLRVISLTGEVLEIIQMDPAERVKAVLELHDLSAGLYLLEIEVDQQKAYKRITVK